ncbi:hypothetical protein [Streptomyces sp. NPDC005799]|uniref:hypothetical protein n=1 Tax=Streptomyces sp. NPDC005799 TaxID=3154678 RepID=UPI0033CB3DB3
MQVVVEQAVRRGVPDAVAVVSGSQLGGVGAQQVVEGVPADDGLCGEQMSMHQFGEQFTGAGGRYAGQGGDGRERGVRAGMQAQ